MGSPYSRHHVARRNSLVKEEFDFPETVIWSCCEDWEFCHGIEIELKSLPAHIRDRIYKCVFDDYTQEILSDEEDVLKSGRETDRLDSRQSQSAPSRLGLARLEKSLPEDKTCRKSKDSPECSCSRKCYQGDKTFRGESCPCDRDGCSSCSQRSDPRNALDAASLVTNGRFSHHLADWKGSLDDRSCCMQPDSSERRNTESHSFKSRNSIDSPLNQTLESDGYCSSVTSSSDLQRDGSNNGGEHGIGAMATSITVPIATNQVRRPKANEKKTCGCQSPYRAESAYSRDVIQSPQRSRRHILRSDPIPMPKSSTATAAWSSSPRVAPRRKVSLKDEPGWIPNPLDSDSENSDLEDSGVFSDSTNSPRLSGCLCSDLSSVLRPQRLAFPSPLLRRNSDSELPPLALQPNASDLSGSGKIVPQNEATSPSVSNSLDASLTAHEASKTARWRVTSAWSRSKVKALLKFRSSRPPQQEEAVEDDLDEQLQWLMTDVIDSPPVAEENEPTANLTSPQREHSANRNSQQTDRPACRQSVLEQSAESVQEPGIQELDWMCEPEWNNFEMELFWSVLRPHLEQLLSEEDPAEFPSACVTVPNMDAADHKMLDRCLLHVQWHIWKGNYRQAVADFRAVKRHFRCCAESHLLEGRNRDDVENLRLVFQRKRPSSVKSQREEEEKYSVSNTYLNSGRVEKQPTCRLVFGMIIEQVSFLDLKTRIMTPISSNSSSLRNNTVDWL